MAQVLFTCRFEGDRNGPDDHLATLHSPSYKITELRSYTMDDILLTESETADFLGKSPITLSRWRREGYGPAYVRVGRSPRYTRQSLADFMSANSILPGGKPAA